MKIVADSNALRDPALLSHLTRSQANAVVLVDYVFIEAIRSDPLTGIHRSLETLALFPTQVLVLKTTWQVCGLHGGSRGLARRLIDVPRTREFGEFCRALARARYGHAEMQGELLRLGSLAAAHLEGVKDDALDFVSAAKQAMRAFSRQEQKATSRCSSISVDLLRKLLQAAAWQSEALFELHPSVRRHPTRVELPNTYIFRSSLTHLLLALKWAYDGGTTSDPAKIRNHLVDAHIAAYSTYFDDVLSMDNLTNRLAINARHVLARTSALGLLH
jgi:hypothetical protein